MELADEVIDRWCAQWLGAGVAAVLFTSGHLSHVAGVRLADGREVVVKVREAQPRLAGCAEVHRSLWRAGFPCPQPLVGPVPLLGYAANAEIRRGWRGITVRVVCGRLRTTVPTI